MAGFSVRLLKSPGAGVGRPTVLGSALTDRRGSFDLAFRAPRPGAVLYLTATPRPGVLGSGPRAPWVFSLASALGVGPIPARVTVNERTTVAAGFAMAQFIGPHGIAGKEPGLRNAAAMSADLVDPRSGAIGSVLRTFPNGRATSTLPTFNSLANLVAGCRLSGPRCAALLRLAGGSGAGPAPTVLEAIAAIARNPSRNVRPLFALALNSPVVYSPDLGKGERPDAWTLALRFRGDGNSMSGPGNFAIDAEGNVWVTVNYEFSRKRREPVCDSKILARFTPTGEYFPGSPYTGGGLSGAGFGITLDPRGHVWVGNFGFAAPEPGCPAEDQPPHNSISEFTGDGQALSPDTSATSGGGFTQGGISWPQGTVSDRKGNIWIANCGNDTVTRYAAGDPERWTAFGGLGIEKPFDIALNGAGDAFVTGNGNSKVAILGPDGKPTSRSPVSGGGLHKPLGIAADSRGNMWVANSNKIDLPCRPAGENQGLKHGTVTMIRSNGALARKQSIEGGGMTVPWGIAVDGNDNVWVANFGGQRLTEICGIRPRRCPPGTATGRPVSPERTGYGFDGLVRNTGVAIDPSGNVWLANNWKTVPFPENPGGYEVVAFLGLAGPLKTPLIGPPQQP